MSPTEAMETHSCSDMADTLQWMHDQWNDPPVVCHYLAALRYEVHMIPYRLFGSDNKVLPKPKDFMLKFAFSDKKATAEEPEDDGSQLEAGVQKMMRLFNDKKVKPRIPPKKKLRPKRKGK